MTLYLNKTVVVTGAGSGIGRACAMAFACSGARVVIADVNTDHAHETASHINQLQDMVTPVVLTLDISDKYAVRTNLGALLASEPCHVLVNCAGIAATCSFLETDIELLDRMYEVNLRGTFLCAREVATVMVEKGIAGAIVNIGSASGARGNAGRAAYGATKAAVANMTQVMAVELAEYGIRVNAVAPGPIDTPLVKAAHSAQTRDTWLSSLALARYGSPVDVSQAVLYLASDQAAYVTGHILYVDGGFHGCGLKSPD